MRRSWVIAVAGVLVALGAYFGCYFMGTAGSHSMEHQPEPELAWLQAEFHLSDVEFKRVCEMHDAYLAGCSERCRRIDEKNEQLKALLARTNAVTPEIETALKEAAQLRAECQKQMLQHFYDLSRTMPPEQGKRYLSWVHGQTISPDSHQEMHH
jgi:hypothetical protein